MTRETVLQQLKRHLFTHGFTYQDFSGSNSSFDLIARKQNLVLVLKALSNIDSLRIEHARDLQKIGSVFRAHSLIIGEKSKVYQLHADVLYERYGLPVLSLVGFEQLLESNLPSQRSFKGQNVVELDTELLRRQREAHALTLKDLSQRAGISLESLHRYEHGQPAQLEAAEKLERLLDVRLIRGINVFHSDEKPLTEESTGAHHSVLDQLLDLGLKLSVFERAPLNAATKEHALMISHADTPSHIAKKAYSLEKAQKITHYPGLIIANESKHLAIGRVPILQEGELSTFSDAGDLLQELENRRRARKHGKKENGPQE
ncbi:MAG: helix-turn-helix domain-containing protein [archaeon]